MTTSALLWTTAVGGVSLYLATNMQDVIIAEPSILILLPFIVFAVLTILGVDYNDPKQPLPPLQGESNVLRVSRTIYDQVDPQVLEMFLSDRDFNADDFERLMQLEAFNVKKTDFCGVNESSIQKLPIVAISEPMLRSSKHPSCSICLASFEIDTEVRLLPCFHHFHPECIDPWLREKAQCPNCKCDVTV